MERLDESLTHKLTLIAAPPGYGKTTLLSIWTKERDLPAAWLSLDGEDNDPSLFFQYLIAALQTIDPQVGHVSLTQLKSLELSSEKAILSALINDLAKIQVDFALILDDYHWIEEQGIHDSLTYMIDHLPAQMHLLVASRSDPPLHLSRLRARNQLLELRQSDLRITPIEASEFLNQCMGLNLSTEQVETLAPREAWPAEFGPGGTSNVTPGVFMGSPLKGQWGLVLVYLIGWFFNIFGEGFWFRSYILPRQELAFGRLAWSVNGLMFTLTHLWQPWILIAILPSSFLLAYAVQSRRNTWIGIIQHGIVNLSLLVFLIAGVIGVL